MHAVRCREPELLPRRAVRRSMPETTPDTPARNLLLAALPADVFSRLQSALEFVALARGRAIYEANEPLLHVYFPTSAIVSLLYTMEDGSTAEMGIVGCDGVVGIAVFMGGDTTPSRAVVQSFGGAYRLTLKRFRGEFRRFGKLHRLLLLYTQALLTQMAQTSVCNRLHAGEQRLCRCLLLSHDRVESDELMMTQELIASMLGVRRGGVSVAAHGLQEAGLIRYRRGRITIVDRSGLETRACECYQVVRTECERLLTYWEEPP